MIIKDNSLADDVLASDPFGVNADVSALGTSDTAIPTDPVLDPLNLNSTTPDFFSSLGTGISNLVASAGSWLPKIFGGTSTTSPVAYNNVTTPAGVTTSLLSSPLLIAGLLVGGFFLLKKKKK